MARTIPLFSAIRTRTGSESKRQKFLTDRVHQKRIGRRRFQLNTFDSIRDFSNIFKITIQCRWTFVIITSMYTPFQKKRHPVRRIPQQLPIRQHQIASYLSFAMRRTGVFSFFETEYGHRRAGNKKKSHDIITARPIMHRSPVQHPSTKL